MAEGDDIFDSYLAAEDAMRDGLYMYKTFTDYGGLFEDFGTEDNDFNQSFHYNLPALPVSI